MNRRRFLACSGTIAAAVAGCISLSGDTEPISRTFETTTAELEHPEAYDSAAISEDGFSTFVGSMRDDRAYDEAGTWGLANERQDDTPEFIGALTESLSHVDRNISTHHAMAVYALDEEGPRKRHQCWLWSGVDVSEVEEGIDEISIEFNAQSDGIAIGAYSPGEPADADQTDQYDIDLSYAIGEGGIASTFPLPDGNIEIIHDTTGIGPGGSVKTRWSGSIADQFAIGMTCVAQWKIGGNWDIDWRCESKFS